MILLIQIILEKNQKIVKINNKIFNKNKKSFIILTIVRK